MSTSRVHKHVLQWGDVMKEKPMRPGIYRIRIFMIKPYENVAVWPRKPDVNSALETFAEAILTMDADEYFCVEMSEA